MSQIEGSALQAVIAVFTATGHTLQRANFAGVNFAGAKLANIVLREANLAGVNFQGADLTDADLFRADLTSANLADANLFGANINYARLGGATFRAAMLPTGELWETYCDEVVPALLQAGGKTVLEVLDTGCWERHTWGDCPMVVAFGTSDFDKIPAIHLPRINQFSQFHDGRLLQGLDARLRARFGPPAKKPSRRRRTKPKPDPGPPPPPTS